MQADEASPRLGEVGRLLLIPTFLESEGRLETLAPMVLAALASTRFLLVENARTARRHLRRMFPLEPLEHWQILEWNKHGPTDLQPVLTRLKQGESVGLLAEAGCPGVADPGQKLVAAAHAAGCVVQPLVGPSSILLALMASGFSGQSFQFHGYLPREGEALRQKLLELERAAALSTQIWIETPYRNQALLGVLLRHLAPSARLCLASALLEGDGWVRSQTLAAWAACPPDLEGRPTVFLLGAERVEGPSLKEHKRKARG